MAVLDGCESRHRTPTLEERACPACGASVEVFTRRSRVIEDAVCDCGYVFNGSQGFCRQQMAEIHPLMRREHCAVFP